MNEQLQIQIAQLAVRMYAESHPRPTQVNRIQAGEMLGLSNMTISKMIKHGSIKLNACGLISISEVDRLLLNRS